MRWGWVHFSRLDPTHPTRCDNNIHKYPHIGGIKKHLYSDLD